MSNDFNHDMDDQHIIDNINIGDDNDILNSTITGTEIKKKYKKSK